MENKTDYLIVGSGLASMVFGALMAQSGKRILMLEAHEFPGGFGHTFEMANKYKFNAQFHYVWNCGEGETVDNVLQKLNLKDEVKFNRYDPDGFDHMYMPGFSLKIPSDAKELVTRLTNLFPNHTKNIVAFVQEVQRVARGLDHVSPPLKLPNILKNVLAIKSVVSHQSHTLQDVFNQFELPLEAQTLLASQWPDFLLPPNQLSFFAWVMLFTGYQRGAYYPEKHFEHVIKSLQKTIENNGGEILFQHQATEFLREDKNVIGVKATDLQSGKKFVFHAKATICGMDPKKAAHWIGIHHFSKALQKKLDYQYSPSNFMAYCVVRDLDLKKYGFGKWNVFHTGHKNLNDAFYQMYQENDYSNPSFAITTPTLLTSHGGDCPPGDQIVELLTVANYEHWKQLKFSDQKKYNKAKMDVLDAMINVIERDYVPDFRKHLVFKMTGSPTTNERYCWCPEGNSYGSNMTPKNIGLNRLDHKSSLNNFYFCNASSGYAGFAGTFWTGARLYEILSKDNVL